MTLNQIYVSKPMPFKIIYFFPKIGRIQIAAEKIYETVFLGIQLFNIHQNEKQARTFLTAETKKLCKSDLCSLYYSWILFFEYLLNWQTAVLCNHKSMAAFNI